jgi:hypothetical protein
MKSDENIGGSCYIMGYGQNKGGRTSVTLDIHFTVHLRLLWALGTRDVVMCVIIMRSEKDVTDLPMSWTLGIDVSKEMHTGKTTLETYNLNYKNGALIGGPKCVYLGKTIPSFVCSAPNAPITSELLVEMLSTIDRSGIFSISEEEGVPFLLFNGHHSCTCLPFLK